MKKKLRLKNWVKKTLIVIATIGVLVVCFKALDTREDIKECVELKHSQYYCEKGLN